MPPASPSAWVLRAAAGRSGYEGRCLAHNASMIQGLAHYNLRAPRPLLETLREFYCEVVGLQVGERPTPRRSFGYWLCAGGVDVLHLSECSPGEVRAIDAVNTFDHAAFRCTERAETERRLQGHGVKYETVQVPHSGVVQIFFSDPAGNGVELSFSEAGA